MPSVRVKVTAKPNETFPQLYDRFRRKVSKSGLMADEKRHRFFTSRSEQKRLAHMEAVRKARRARKKKSY